MRYLLDTHTLIWFTGGDKQLSKTAQQIIEDGSNQIFVSVVSLWEIGIKVSIGKLELSVDYDDFVVEELRENQLTLLDITIPDLQQSRKLPFHHKDPFDRMLIAQSLAQQLPIIGRDSRFVDYGVRIIW